MTLDVTLMDPGSGPDPMVMRDLQSDAVPNPLQRLAIDWGCHAVLAAPMVAGDQRVGVLVITAADSDAFPREEIALWKTLSTTLGVIVSLSHFTSSEPAESP